MYLFNFKLIVEKQQAVLWSEGQMYSDLLSMKHLNNVIQCGLG